jgi:hypothetical protein
MQPDQTTEPRFPVSDGASLERVSGPWEGLYVACYTTLLDGRFNAYAKIYAARPADAWAPDPLLKVGTAAFDEEAAALEAAELHARALVTRVRAILKVKEWLRAPQEQDDLAG